MGDDRQLLAEGREAEVYLQPDGSVLKLMRQPTDIGRVQAEAAACRLLAERGHVAPAVREIVMVDDRPGLVMERIDGTDLLAALERRPLRVFAAARVLAESHVAMHECEAPAELPDLKDQLRERINLAAPLPSNLRDRALEVLAGLPRGDRLCHGDLHLGNMLGSWSAAVVIDWGSASRGDAMADVARTELLHLRSALPPGTPATFRVLASVGRRLLTDRYLRLYGRSRPLDGSLDRWRFVTAAARLADPIPEEHPLLLSLLTRTAPGLAV